MNRLSATRHAGVRSGVVPQAAGAGAAGAGAAGAGAAGAGAAGAAHRSRRGMQAVHSQTCWHCAATLTLSIPSSSR